MFLNVYTIDYVLIMIKYKFNSKIFLKLIDMNSMMSLMILQIVKTFMRRNVKMSLKDTQPNKNVPSGL